MLAYPCVKHDMQIDRYINAKHRYSRLLTTLFVTRAFLEGIGTAHEVLSNEVGQFTDYTSDLSDPWDLLQLLR